MRNTFFMKPMVNGPYLRVTIPNVGAFFTAKLDPLQIPLAMALSLSTVPINGGNGPNFLVCIST